MIGTRRVLGLITARGGSKGLPRKNVRLLGGKPLIAWTIEAAKRSATIDRLILSSDDAEIIAVAREWGCEAPFVRPAALATDSATSLDVVRHALTAAGEGFDYVALLQPTTPLRCGGDIDHCVRLCEEKGASTCVSACETDKSPYWMFQVGADRIIRPLFTLEQMPDRRQAAPIVYVLNGAVYVASCRHILGGGSFVEPDTVVWTMPKARSIDIDTEQDLMLAEHTMKSTHA